MKWIKASERVWPYGKATVVRHKGEVYMAMAHNLIECYSKEDIEWLDEEDNEWIDVKDRLPEWDKENAVEVIMMGDAGVFFGVYYGKFQSVYLFALGDRDGEINDITHWQPLPAPPTKKQLP